MSATPRTARWRHLGAAVAVFALSCAATPVTADPQEADVRVRFGDDCGSATVSAAGPVSELVTVFSDERSERIGELPRAASYLVRVSPGAVASGLTISTLYVHAGEPLPSGGTGASGRYECVAAGSHRRHSAMGRGTH